MDLQEGTVTLNLGTTKNDEGRVIYMTEELKSLILTQWEERKASGKLLPYVFPNEGQFNRIIKTLIKQGLENGLWEGRVSQKTIP